MIRINLLPSAHHRRKSVSTLPLMIGIMVAVLVLGGGGFYFYEYTIINKLQAQQAELTRVMEDYNRQKGRLDEIRRALADLERRLAIKTEILKGTLDVPALVAEFSAFTPKDVKYTGLSFANGLFTASVVTTSYASAANALISLEAAPSFSDVATDAASKSPDGQVMFSVGGKLVTGGEQDGPATH